MTPSDIINLCLTIVTIIIAIVALWQTQKQTKLSNKQQLFDRRLEKYIVIKDLLTRYVQNRDDIKSRADLVHMKSWYCLYLTDCTYFEEVHNLIEQESASIDTMSKFNKVMKKYEKICTEIELLWTAEFTNDISEFIRLYVNLIVVMYHQDFCDKFILNNDKPKTYEEYENGVKDRDSKSGLYKVIDIIDKAYEKLVRENTEQKLLESIRL